MAALVIARRNEWTNSAREIGLYLDDEKIGTIWNAEKREFDVSPGEHTLKCKIDWCGSQTYSFMIQEGEIVAFNLSAFAFAKWLPVVFLSMLGLHLIVEAVFHVDYVLWLSLPLFAMLIYYFTLGANKYLVLTSADK